MLAAITADTYKNPRKADYRRQVARAIIGKRKARNLCGLMLTGPEGKEIPVWRRYGVHDSNMVLVDCKAECLANAQKRNQSRRAKAYNLTIGETIPALMRDGIRLNMANLDYCGYLSKSRLLEIHDFFGADIWRKGSRVCITYLKARDHDALALAKEYCGGDRNLMILQIAEHASGRKVKIVASGKYCGGKNRLSPMAWVVIKLD